jgi:hypothetical protein
MSRVEGSTDDYVQMEKARGSKQLMGYWRDYEAGAWALLEWDATENERMKNRVQIGELAARWHGEKPPVAELLGRPILATTPRPGSLERAGRGFIVQCDVGPPQGDPSKPGATLFFGSVLLKAHIFHFYVTSASGNDARSQEQLQRIEKWLEFARQLNPSNMTEAAWENDTGKNDWWSYRYTLLGGVLMVVLVAFMRKVRQREDGQLNPML